MSFTEFHGNSEVVQSLRGMLARDRFPHALILAGPRGAGKFTLAQMIAKAMNCLERFPTLSLAQSAMLESDRVAARNKGGAPNDKVGASDGLPDFCGHCANCRRIGESDPLEQ